jgi:DNA repair exonuclease SbcCD nuclease subunit
LNKLDQHGRNIRELDFYRAFDAAIDKAIELEPECVIHAGDLFHGYHPSAAALAVALDGIHRLVEQEIPLIVIAGNHSTPRMAAAHHIFAVLERFDHTGLVHPIHEEPAVIRVGGLAVHALPHRNDADLLTMSLHEAAPLADADFNVVVAHTGFLHLESVGAGEAGSIALSGEELEAVAEFDYIALGHLHKHARVRVNAIYSGSLERVTWADDAPEKGVVEVNLARDRYDREWFRIHGLPTRPYVRLPEIDARDQEDPTEAIVAAASAHELDGALVRLRVNNVSPAASANVNRNAINAAFRQRECLHFELEVQATPEGQRATVPQELREFLASRVPKGADAADFIARAERYMTRAAQELGA